MANFKLTYGNMFNPPEEMHKGFDKAVAKLKDNLGREYGMFIDCQDVFAENKFEDRSPVNTDWVLAVMQKGEFAIASNERWRCGWRWSDDTHAHPSRKVVAGGADMAREDDRRSE